MHSPAASSSCLQHSMKVGAEQLDLISWSRVVRVWSTLNQSQE